MVDFGMSRTGGQFISNTTKSGKEESNNFFLLLDRKNIGGFFNLQERSHR